MDPTTHTPTIILAVGILCVFLGVFGGGFQIKEISIPKINNVSRAMGAVFGLALIVWSQYGIKNPEDISAAKTELATKDVVASANPVSPPVSEPAADATRTSNLNEKIDELKPLWENLDIANKDILAEYQKIKEDSEFENLSLIYKSEVNNKMEILSNSIEVYAALDKTLADEMMTLKARVEYLDNFFSNEAGKIRLAQREKEGLAKEKALFLEEIESSARVGTANDFLTCEAIVNKNCSKSTSLFKTSTVWAWMKLETPENTEVTLRWINLDDNDEINSRKYTIPKATGYRISASKSIDKAGQYELRLFNKKSKLIAKKQFEVR